MCKILTKTFYSKLFFLLPLSKWNDSILYGINYKNIILILLIYIEDMISLIVILSIVAYSYLIVLLSIIHGLLRIYYNRDSSLSLGCFTYLIMHFLSDR